MVRRLDRNDDGVISPDEVSDRARPFVERLAQQAGVDADKDIPTEKLLESARNFRRDRRPDDDEQRGRSSRGSHRDRGSDDRQGRGSSDRAADDRLAGLGWDNGDDAPVPGFGVEVDLPEVPGFGLDADASAGPPLKELYERRVLDYVNRIFSRYDRNEDAILDQEEWKSMRWRGDPKDSDLDDDGKLSKREMCERLVKRWNWGRREREEDRSSGTSSRDSSGSAGESSPAGQSSDDGGRVRRYAQSLLKQYDENGNGVLEKDEWSKMSGNRQKADVNGDGTITLDELTADLDSYGKTSSASTGYGSSASRGASSRGGRSYRSTGRTSTAAASYRSRSGADRLLAGLPDWFARNDTSGNGQIEMVEFSSVWSESKAAEFARYDLNGDGVITAAECLAAEGEE